MGADTLTGGAGDDRYVMDTYAGESVVENAGDGVDVVYAQIDYALSPNVEQIILVKGPAALNASGNEEANVMFGNAEANVLYGNGGDDSLSGGAGNDVELGGNGNDAIDGGSGDDILYGGSGEDIIHGGGGDDYLQGDDGNDTFRPGAGYDYMTGGAGEDTFRFDQGGFQQDAIFAFTHGMDTLAISSSIFPSFSELQANTTQQGADTIIDAGAGDVIVLANFTASTLTAADFHLF